MLTIVTSVKTLSLNRVTSTGLLGGGGRRGTVQSIAGTMAGSLLFSGCEAQIAVTPVYFR